MKKFIVIMLFMLAAFVVSSPARADMVTTTLLAGQHINAGTVSVWNDGSYLYVKFETTDDWNLSETHVDVSPNPAFIPQKNGNPIPGKFDYKMEHSPLVTEYTYQIDLAWAADTVLYVAAHAVVVKPVEGEYETVWQIGDMEVVNETTNWLENYADEFNWEDPAGPTTPGPTLGQSAPAYTDPFIVGTTPVSEFPYNSNTGFPYATDFDVKWTGELPFGGTLTISWSPGRSYPAETKRISGDGITTAQFQAAGTTQAGMGWFLDIYPLVQNQVSVDPLGMAEHTIRFEHLAGDGTFWDWILLEKPKEQDETGWGDGTDFAGKNWAMYITYTVQEED